MSRALARYLKAERCDDLVEKIRDNVRIDAHVLSFEMLATQSILALGLIITMLRQPLPTQ